MHLEELPVDIRRQVQALGQANVAPEPTPEPTPSDVKAQAVRMGDILLFGPLMIMGAFGKEPPQWMRAAMLIIGVGTILYNAANFIEIEKRKGNIL